MDVSSDVLLKNPRIWKWKGRYYSSDGQIYTPNKVPKLSMEDGEKYKRELGESQGFDVNYYPGMCYGLYFIPVGLGPNLSLYERFAEAAVRLHNEGRVSVDDIDMILVAVGIDITKEKSCGPVSFERIIKLMEGCYHFFITLEARDLEDGCVKIYQAIVEDLPGRDPLLKLFRLKPVPSILYDKRKKMGHGVSSGGGQSSLGYLFGDGEAPKPAAEKPAEKPAPSAAY